jgi:ATP/maltotriose-dependent transcriptional regulator MalT
MSRPGMMRDDILEIGIEILSDMENYDDYEEHLSFQPHFISVLRGEKDYCSYFMPKKTKSHIVEKFREIADRINDPAYSMMLKFMEAEVHYEKNELDQALDKLVRVSREAKIGANQRMQQLCTIAMADLLAAKNQMSNSDSFPLDTIDAEDNKSSLFLMNCRAHKIYYHLLRGEKEPITYWMNHIAPNEQERFFSTQYDQYLMKSKVYIWMGQHVRARMILQILLDYAEQYQMAYLEAQVRILEAVIYYKEDSNHWQECLIPALKWARELGFVRVFADEGAAVYELLSRIASEDKEWEKDEFLKRVIFASKAQMLQYPKYLKMEQDGEIGEFSNSEKSVMSLLVLGEKNAEIAAHLCVSENTVKYHLKNIYQKLQVKSRSQAIHKIGEHNLI